jgi:hypothetical protein
LSRAISKEIALFRFWHQIRAAETPQVCASCRDWFADELAQGGFLRRDESNTSYAVIRHNILTYQSAGVVQVIKGRENAEKTLRMLQDCQGSADHQDGWRYFFEKTGLKPGMDPAQATHLREADLEMRESQAGQDQAGEENIGPTGVIR